MMEKGVLCNGTISRQRLNANIAPWSDFEAMKPVGLSIRDRQAFRGRRLDLISRKMGSSAMGKFARQHSGTTTALWLEFETMRQWACPFETGKLSVMEGGIARRGRWGPP